MREIEFRGKEIDTGGWVFGYYVKKLMPLNNLNGICHYIYGEVEDADGKFHNDSWEVIPETVGQYTGLKGMYEDDKISDNLGTGVIEYVDKYAAFRVNYQNGRCKWFYDYLDSEIKTIEIAGNIHDKGETHV